jgi:PAS domain S-box-containing protein
VPVLVDGKVVYSLGISVSLEHLNNILRAQNLPPGWIAAALDSSGTIVGRNINPEKFLGNKATPLLMQGFLKYREASIQATTQEGTAVQTSLSKSPTTNWAVAIAIPRQSLQQAMLMSLAKLAGIVAAMFAIGLILAWLMGGRIARSVKALTTPAIALGNGADFQIPDVHIREVDEVGLAMSRTATLLKERDSTLRQREAEVAEAYALLRNVIDSTPVLIYLKDLSGRLLLANKSYEKMIDSSPISGRITVGSRHEIGPENKTTPSAADLKAIESGDTIYLEEDVSTEEGIKHYAISKAPLRNSEGAITGICAAAIDITPLKIAEAKIQVLVQTLEKRVEQRTEELNQANGHLQQSNEQLAQANDQLEAFSYTVAHDLRAPLRGINGFSDAVVEDYGHLLDETGREYLQRISKAAMRMEQLIEDLLAFSRLSRMELTLGTVSLDEVLQEVLTNLSAQIRESHSNITVASDLPFVRANRTACVQIFQNLVSNAIKFTRANEPARIKVRFDACNLGQEAYPAARIWIEDNGIGIPQQQKSRIFKPFERLHGIDEYQGSGIGLAIVATAVYRMHGRCGVESELGVGSRFWVELPVVKTESQ